MSNHVSNLRRTRADMLGTDDEVHYWECHEAADYIKELEALEKRLRAAAMEDFDRIADLEEENERLTAVLNRVAAWYHGAEIASGELEQILAAVEEKDND